MHKYEKIKEIGKGNYGKAILVKNKFDSMLYVLKSIDISNFCRQQLENAIYEANLIKSLNHPFIIKYVESFFEDKTLCIIMEYADCGDLYKITKYQKKIGLPLK